MLGLFGMCAMLRLSYHSLGFFEAAVPILEISCDEKRKEVH